MPNQTPSQTVGPFFAYGLTPEQYGYPFASIADGRMADESVSGERIRVVGQVLDGEGGYCVWGKLVPAARSRDLDALPMQDLKDVPYRSQNPGVAHACGRNTP